MSATLPSTPARPRLNIALWIAQILVALVFIMVGVMKLTTPIPELSKTIIWAGQYPEWMVRTLALVDLAGGIGILLPALIRILPGLTVWAALGCSVLQICALVFHLSRGEAMLTPLNIVLLCLAIFVYWGRKKLPILPR